jgi:integrase
VLLLRLTKAMQLREGRGFRHAGDHDSPGEGRGGPGDSTGDMWCHSMHESVVESGMGHRDVATTMIYTHVLNRGGVGVRSPIDGLQ